MNKRIPEYLTLKQFQEYIVNWSQDTMRHKREAGLPHLKLGPRSHIYPAKECLEWLKRHTKAS